MEMKRSSSALKPERQTLRLLRCFPAPSSLLGIRPHAAPGAEISVLHARLCTKLENGNAHFDDRPTDVHEDADDNERFCWTS